MAKLYFKYGTMGSSKTAQALITKFNYEERGMTVLLLKPKTDNRDGEYMVRSRIGLGAYVDYVIEDTDNIYTVISNMQSKRMSEHKNLYDVVIVDEAQFIKAEQIDQLKKVSMEMDIPVLCFGLKTDFQTHLFKGSKRLLEIAESITEIKMICECGKKAIVNARIDKDGHIVTTGDQVEVGGNERYLSMCYECWTKRIDKEREITRNGVQSGK